MSLIANLCSSLCPCSAGEGKNREAERAIDSSVRLPVLGMVKASATWFVLASILGSVAFIKLHNPSFLADCAYLTFGKVKPAFTNALLYGGVFNAGLACACWMLARLGGAPIGRPALLIVSNAIWNLGVLVGLVGIFKGDQLPYAWLEFPGYVGPLLFAAFAGMATWILLAFRERRTRSNFAAQWLILAAVFSFAWSFTAAQAALVCMPAPGAFQAVVSAWYASNILLLVVVPLGLAAAFYLLPKLTGNPIEGYSSMGRAFWAWILCASFAGTASLAGGPIPAWVSTTGIIASFALIYPASIFLMQLLGSLFRNFDRVWETTALRFVFVGGVAFAFFIYYTVKGALRGTQDIVQLTSFAEGVQLVGLLGFATMMFSGGIHFLMPRLLGKAQPCSGLIEAQFWCQTLGVFLIGVGLISGGQAQGHLVNQSVADLGASFVQMKSHYIVTSLGLVAYLIGALAFAGSFFAILFSSRKPETAGDLLPEAPEMDYLPQ